MIKVSTSDIKKLRDMTGAGMMDCKKALTEAEGDFDEAIEFLRKKGQKLSAKRADREAKEGVVIAQVNDEQNRGVVVRISCETDFVAKNNDFVQLAQNIADIALENFPATKVELLGMSYNDALTIQEKLTEQIGIIGEKIELVDYEHLEAELVVPYIHMGYRAGVILGLSETGEEEETAGKNIAMQVAAMRPISVDKDNVDQGVVDKELEIAKEQAKQMGKPDHILDRIAEGMLKKFFQENTLLSQAYVKDGNMSVGEYLRSVSPDLTVTDFKHVELG